MLRAGDKRQIETTFYKNTYLISQLGLTFAKTKMKNLWFLPIHFVHFNSELTQQDSTKKRSIKRLCVTNITGLLPTCKLRCSINITVFLIIHKRSFKRTVKLAEIVFKQNYCPACHIRFAVFLPLPSLCVSSLTAHVKI